MMKTAVVSLGMSKCIWCGVVFELKSKNHPKQKYCSQRCIRDTYSAKYPERDVISKQKYAAANKEKHAAATEKYRKANPGYYREYQSLRTRYVMQAKPVWLNEWEEFFISEFYDLAVKRKLHVDHIIPIKHPLVCGLHVPWNMQLLTPMQNFSKSNKFNPDDEDVICVFHEE